MNIYPGITARQHLTVQKQMGLLTYKISCLMGKRLTNSDSENHFKAQFGSMVDHHLIFAKDLSRLHQFGKKVLPGVFLGYVLYAGGIWKGDVVVADIEELEKMDASEIHVRRLDAKEVLTPMKGDNSIFPVADGTVKLSGGDQVLRTSP